jgi:hypothetical protein
MPTKPFIGQKTADLEMRAGNTIGTAVAPAPLLPRRWEVPWEKWETAQLPLALLDRIAAATKARNPIGLQQRTIPTYPMDVSLLLIAVEFEEHKQRLQFQRPTRSQIKQIKRVAESAEELLGAIKLLGESARFRLKNEYKGAQLPLDDLHKLLDAARTAANPKGEKLTHRPTGSFKHRSLNLLIAGLYGLIVEEAQGELTLWEDASTGRLKGTLPAVLEILRPHLNGILPKKIPFSTLHRALARAKQANAP